MRLVSLRLVSAQYSIWSTVREFSVSSINSVGNGGSLLSILTPFLSNRSQLAMVDGYRSKLVNVISGVSQSSVLGPLLFILVTSELFSIMENKMIGYANDSMLCYILCCVISRH